VFVTVAVGTSPRVAFSSTGVMTFAVLIAGLILSVGTVIHILLSMQFDTATTKTKLFLTDALNQAIVNVLPISLTAWLLLI